MIWLEPLLAAALEVAADVARTVSDAPAALAGRTRQGSVGDHRLGDFLVQGEALFGWRGVGVSGDRAQFDEDLGIDSGPLIRDLKLEGRRTAGEGWLAGWSLDASGLGDPASLVTAEIEGTDAQVLGRYQRTSFTGTSDSDIHSFDVQRERALLRVESAGADPDGVRGGIEAFWEHSDSFSAMTRSVDFGFVSPVPTEVDSRALGLRGDLGLLAGGWDLALDAGAAWMDSSDRRSFAQPSPSDPTTIQTEDFQGDVQELAWDGGLRATRALSSRLELDLGVQGEQGDGDGELSIFESGVLFGPGLNFTRDTQGDADFSSGELSLDAGLRYEMNEDLECFTRAWVVDEEADAHLDKHIVLDESGVISVLDVSDVSRYESRLLLLEAGVETALSPTSDLTVAGRAGRESIDLLETVQGVVSRQFDGDLDRYGADATLSFVPTPTLTWSVSGGYGVDPAHNSFEGTGFAYDDDIGARAQARVRWRPQDGPIWTATLSHREYDSRALQSESVVDALGLSAAGKLAKSWNGQAGLSLQQVSLQAETTQLIGIVQVPLTVQHDVLQVLANLGVGWQASASLEPACSLSVSLSTGDIEYATTAARLDLPLRVSSDTYLGLELETWIVDAQSGIDLSDYEAIAATFYIRTAF